MQVWRRHEMPLIYKAARIVHAIALKGVGRVPVQVEDGVVVSVFLRSNKTYTFRFFDRDMRQKWLQVLPAGGYASPVYVPERSGLWVPFNYSEVAELDAQNGEVRWTIDFDMRVRSAPIFDRKSGAYLMAIGNTIVRYNEGKILQQKELPAHFFFGLPLYSEGIFLTLAARRHNGNRQNTVIALDSETLSILWEANVGESCVISSDTSGLGIEPDNRCVVVNAPPGRVVCLDIQTGKELWSVDLGITNWRSAPEVTKENVYVGSLEGDLVALSTKSGQVRWHIHLDPLGIWSPPLISVNKTLIVHGGTWLWGVNADDGSIKWAVPVGFNAYTRPVRYNDYVVISGGDPPDDGYLFWIRTQPCDPRGQYRAQYIFGQDRDYLIIECELDKDVQEVRLDLSPFGRSCETICRREGSKFRWEGVIDIQKRWAESVIVGRMYRREGSPTWFTIWVDTGSTRDVRDATKRVIYDFDASSQVDAISSGGAIISALLSRWGRVANPDDIVQAARWMKNKGVDPHHLWRGGGARILTANQFPLPESTKQQLTPEEVEDLISRWEQQGN